MHRVIISAVGIQREMEIREFPEIHLVIHFPIVPDSSGLVDLSSHYLVADYDVGKTEANRIE
jgi:hypothetical protein